MFMPLQLFASRHPEFDFFWNWEMDVRYTGHYHQLFSSVSTWAKDQTESGLWERNKRFYISSVHGSYETFAKSISGSSREKDVRPSPAKATAGGSPPSIDSSSEADLITLFPTFDTDGTQWPHKDHLVNYNSSSTPSKRYGTVGTNMRFSRGLLNLTAKENSVGHGMMSEMWPHTLASQYGLKAVFVPHPVFLDRQWPPKDLQNTFNAGPNGQVGGSPETVINQEPAFDGSTWFWNSKFGLDLYRRWLGRASEGPGSPEVGHSSMHTGNSFMYLSRTLTRRAVGNAAWAHVPAGHPTPSGQELASIRRGRSGCLKHFRSLDATVSVPLHCIRTHFPCTWTEDSTLPQRKAHFEQV